MNLSRAVATCFNIGKIPIAPGTFGSFIGLCFWALLPLNAIIQLLIIIILFIIGLYSSNIISHQLNDKDPSEIIIDEVVGISIALYMLPNNFILYFLSFCFFRFFDIYKPSFIYHIQKLPNGWGIMMDDILAGLISLLLVNGIRIIL